MKINFIFIVCLFFIAIFTAHGVDLEQKDKSEDKQKDFISNPFWQVTIFFKISMTLSALPNRKKLLTAEKQLNTTFVTSKIKKF